MRKKYISPHVKREKSKVLSSKSKDHCQNRIKTGDKKYFEYVKNNESVNYYDSKKNKGFHGINISIQESDNKSAKYSKKPQYGTGNMSHVIALLNDKKNSISSQKKTKRNSSNNASMKKLGNTSKGKFRKFD